MSKATFEIEGLEELLKAFAELGPNAIHKLSEPSVEGAELVAGRAKMKIIDQTGDLANSIKVYKPGKSTSKKAYRIFAKVGFSKKGMHGVPLELGHKLYYFGHKTNRRVEQKPFLRPAADMSKDEVGNIMVSAMNKVLNEWGE